MRYKNTFIQSKLNKDVDERLLPKGQYPHAENVRVANTDGSDSGAVENVKGNEPLTSFSLTNAKTIGAFSDDSNQKIYWFVTSDTKDLVVEYNYLLDKTTIVLQSDDGTLNFSEEFLITGVVKVINGESKKDLLLWTDDNNPPRCINIDRFKENNTLNSFTSEDISLIKKPPTSPLNVTLVNTDTEAEDNLKDKFLSFAYRYVYKDGERSALSSFTNYQFFPKSFSLDVQTMDNEGMVNSFNAVDITLNTGGEKVMSIEVIAKESQSNTLFIIEKFNKEDEEWLDNTSETFRFSNNKKYLVLPEDELFRSYDNVPLKAKSLELINTRIVFGNYVEGYDLVDVSDNPVVMGYTLSLNSLSSSEVSLPTSRPVGGQVVSDDTLEIDFTGVTLSKDTEITFDIFLTESGGGSFNSSFLYVLEEDYNTLADLYSTTSFINDFFKEIYDLLVLEMVDYTGGTLDELNSQDFVVTNPTSDTLRIVAPRLVYEPVGAALPETQIMLYTSDNELSLNQRLTGTSLKTNRSYEVGMIYLDEYNRASTVQTSLNNTLFIGQENVTSKNKIQVEIPSTQKPPKWAERFKFVVKQTKGDYHTVYTNYVYKEDDYLWILLEGDNTNKIKEGDEIIIKAEEERVFEEVIKTKILSVESKESNFIEGNFSVIEDNKQIKERAGLYAKIKAGAFPLASLNTSSYYDEASGLSRVKNVFPEVFVDLSTTFDESAPSTPIDVEITAGSVISIKINSRFNYDAGWSSNKFEKEYTVIQNYATFEDWFNDDVTNMFDENGQDYLSGVEVVRGLPDRLYEGWFNLPAVNNNKLYLKVTGLESGSSGSRNAYVDVEVNIMRAGGRLTLETVPQDSDINIFYETSEVFEIDKINNIHKGNIQDQTDTLPAIIDLDFYNCYTFGNGVESYRYRDGFNTKTLNIDLRPTTTSVEEYREIRRYADLTYSETYNENNGLNGLNEFNLSKANYKEDIDKKYGYIQKLYSRDTDLLVFQEDKVSKVLYGKELLMNADGTSNITSVENVLGQQVPFMGEYGISRNPESFDFNGYGIYFTDAKRGAVMRLSNNGLQEISSNGMRGYFRDSFKENIDSVKLGAFDPFQDQYVIHVKETEDSYTLTYDEKVKGWTSFHSFTPEFMVGMNNNFFTFKEGELYKHHSDNVIRNTYYGTQFPSKISVMVNDNPSDIKELQAVSLEGNCSWNALISAFVGMTDDFIRSTIDEVEFVRKEGIWYAFARRNEDENHFDSKSTYGIGVVQSVDFSTVIVNGTSDLLTTGDKVIKGADLSTVGTIQTVSVSGGITTITLDAVIGLTEGDFIVGMKNPRYEGGNLRGYTLKIDLDIQKDDKVELFAVNSEVIKSYS